MASMSFLKDFKKSVDKMEGVAGSLKNPTFWVSFGNKAVNKIMSGSFHRGIPQGRITALCGPSSAGKSFVTASLCRGAQQDGAFLLVIDTENALDDAFMTKAGVDVTKDYMYVAPTTVSQCTKIVSNFIRGYREEYGDDPNAPPILICIDSLDYLMTDSAWEDYNKGEAASDQGLQTKKLKEMLRSFAQDIKQVRISMVVTKQVYKARQDQLLAGEGIWVINDAIRYACSQIMLITRLKLKDDATKQITGIRMKVEGFKTRFTRPFQTVTLSVPYETGVEEYDGVFDIALSMGIIIQQGSWYLVKGKGDKKYRRGEIMETMMPEITEMCESETIDFVNMLEDDDVEVTENVSPKEARAQQAN